MIANRLCKVCDKWWYLPLRRPMFVDESGIGQRLIRLATEAVTKSTFICPNCSNKDIDRWETDGGK